MKTIKLILLTTALIITACKTSKKTTTSTASTTTSSSTTSSTTTSTTSAGPVLVSRSPDGIYEPGDAELSAIQVHYKDVTKEKLKEGHELYTKGACTNCHSPKSIYKREVIKWQFIIDDMAQRAKLTEAQKDAVFKYVLAIKATQIK